MPETSAIPTTPLAHPEPSLTVRRAGPRDAQDLARLAAELNEHQGDPSDNFPPEVILRDGFGAEPHFHALIAELDGAAVGYALLVPAYETGWGAPGYYLNDMHVTASARRRGVGRALLAAAAHHTTAMGRRYLWWATRAWNEEAQAFYRALGAFDEPLRVHVLAEAELRALAAQHPRAD